VCSSDLDPRSNVRAPPHREVTDVTQARHAMHTPSAASPRLTAGTGPMIRTFARLTVSQHGTALVPDPEAARRDGAVPSTNGHSGAGRSHSGGGRTCPGVTAEELTILALMANGLTLDSVAVRVSMSQRTLSRRLRCVCDRLGVAHPIQAIVWAAHRGLI